MQNAPFQLGRIEPPSPKAYPERTQFSRAAASSARWYARGASRHTGTACDARAPRWARRSAYSRTGTAAA